MEPNSPMKRLNKLLSYLCPITVELASSKMNPMLEVVFRDGRYQLNSTNTNYSYGGLYELFRLIFKEIYIDWEKVHNVLILGFGTGCVVPLIQKHKQECSIVGVEIDEKIIYFGRKYFNVDKLANTKVVCDNALNFITSTNQKFDLVIIDVYVDVKVPEELETLSFLQSLKKIIGSNGTVIFNKLQHCKEVKNQIPLLRTLYQEVFDEVKLYTIMETGRIFVAKSQNA